RRSGYALFAEEAVICRMGTHVVSFRLRWRSLYYVCAEVERKAGWRVRAIPVLKKGKKTPRIGRKPDALCMKLSDGKLSGRRHFWCQSFPVLADGLQRDFAEACFTELPVGLGFKEVQHGGAHAGLPELLYMVGDAFYAFAAVGEGFEELAYAIGQTDQVCDVVQVGLPGMLRYSGWL